ncbi:TOG array regulator of axonemal microtubules protein 1-like isoform X3 [Haliotis rufescens]|uniref:TOG array regulator of axonemal microtubules protein 1-like isoform X3 n=1 Tax=Haliotis rufescens TaxID=6454 RepID=UPI00201FA237|nr:TOG array regulator of axonemal microtubules protein 1-like isoform X3 [Haliotis rufescens]
MASKVQVAKFPVHTNDFSDVPRLGPISHGHWNMEENEILDRLNDDSSKNRVEILEQLIITVKRNGGRLPYTEPLSIYKGLAQALSDSSWEIRLKCIQLLNEVIPHAKEDLDHFMAPVIHKLIPNIGDTKVTVKRAVIQTLHVYMKYTHDVPALLRGIVRIGLESDDSKVRKETVSALPVILTKEFAHENFFDVIQSLAKKLLDSSVEDNLQDSSLFTLGKIEALVGEREFSNYLQKLSSPLRNYYLKLSGKQANGFSETPNPTPRQGPNPVHSNRRSVQAYPEPELNYEIPYQGNMPFGNLNGSIQQERHAQYMDSLHFGIIPSHVMNHINDQENFRTRAQAVEELKSIVNGLEDYELAEVLMPEMAPFINFLGQLLDDSNFKITSVTLEILFLLVEKLRKNVKHFLKPLISALAKRMCDNKAVARQAVMKVAIKMMQSYAPKPVLQMIAENLKHRNSRVRQETINVIIAALLTFPSYDFDLPSICQVVGPTLTDGKRQVRQAALECFSVLAQAMGSGRLQPLVHAVDQVELTTEGEGLMAAVQARLARRQLPRLNSDGLVEYATPIPSSATHRTPPNMAQGADMEWILSVSGTGSARSSRSDPHMELESVTGSARSTPAVPDTPTSAPRRFMSAGRGRNKFPWEEEKDERARMYEGPPGSAPTQAFMSDDPPPKPRNTWMNDNEVGQDPRRVPKRRSTVMGINAGEEAPEHGSYMQIYKRKQQANVTRINNYALSDQGETTIKADQGSVTGDDSRTDEDETPIFLKPTLARGSATRRKSPKVPPINTSSSPSYSNIRDDDSDSAYAASLDDVGGQEMQSSLRQIRNSASKKKAERLEKQSSRQSLNSSPPFSDNNEESGIFSTMSQKDEENRKKGKNSPFESKPKLARNNSVRKKNGDGFDIEGSSSNISQNYNPASGVTFRENRNSDVQVVGKGYNDDSSSTDSRPLGTVNNKAARDRRRVTKGSTLSPLGMTSLHSYGAIEIDDDKTPSQEHIALFGKGMFDQPPATTEYPVSGMQSRDRLDRRLTGGDPKAVPNGVVGVGVRQNEADLGFEEDMDEDLNASMTKTFREKIAAKQQQQREEVELKKFEQEKKRQEKEERQREKERKEKERQQEKLRRLSSSESIGLDGLTISGSGSNSTTNLGSPTRAAPPKVTQPAITPRKKIKTVNEPVSSHPMSATSHSPTTKSENPEDWKPFRDADGALREALKKIGQDDWEVKMEAINLLRRLTIHHPETLSGQLHTVILAIIAEVKNLRSQVSRLAITCLAEMFSNLKRQMDQDLDNTTKCLLAKSGESNHFIRTDVDRALKAMMENVTATRALLAIIMGGASHKNTAVRRTTAQCLVVLVEKMGPGKILSGVKDITDRVLPTAAQFALDSSQETRYYGKKILYQLMSHQDIDKMLTKYLPANTLRSVQDVVDNLRQKGLGGAPSETSSARSQRSGSSVRGGSASSSAESVNTPQPKRKSVRTDEGTMDDIREMIGQLGSNDWKTRHAGITQFQQMTESNPNAVSSQLVKIFDKFLPRLQDSNSKVNLHALQVMLQVIPQLKDSMLSGVLNMAIGNVAPNLSSKNREIYTTATDILECFIEHMDSSLLIQPFANQAQSVSARSKPDMVLKVAYLVDRVYSKKQKQVILHVLPLLWHLLGAQNSSGALHGGSSDLRQAMGSLVSVLYKHMGQSLIEKASSDPNVSTRHLNLLQELIDQS